MSFPTARGIDDARHGRNTLNTTACPAVATHSRRTEWKLLFNFKFPERSPPFSRTTASLCHQPTGPIRYRHSRANLEFSAKFKLESKTTPSRVCLSAAVQIFASSPAAPRRLWELPPSAFRTWAGNSISHLSTRRRTPGVLASLPTTSSSPPHLLTPSGLFVPTPPMLSA
jgi:hypothetical protein